MAADSQDFEQFLLKRQAAGRDYVSGNPEPLGRVVAQQLPATFFSPRGDVTTGTEEVWARYERDASLFASGSENKFETLDSAADGDVGLLGRFPALPGEHARPGSARAVRSAGDRGLSP